jgi:hypothetical protein
MRRIEQDPEEIQQMQDALSRASEPIHPPSDHAEVIGKGSFMLIREQVIIPDNIILGEE